MVDRIVPFRPRRDRDDSESHQDRMEQLEHLEELLELMHEHGVETRLELERRIQDLEAALDDEDPHGPRV
jgi:hypothetical protein